MCGDFAVKAKNLGSRGPGFDSEGWQIFALTVCQMDAIGEAWSRGLLYVMIYALNDIPDHTYASNCEGQTLKNIVERVRFTALVQGHS